MVETLYNIDKAIVDFIHFSLKNNILDYIIPKITNLGELGVIWIIISIILLISKKYRKIGFTCILALLLSLLFTDLSIKQLVQRQRPIIRYPIENSLIAIPTSYSFPSGHTSSSFAAAWVLYRQMDKYKLTFLVLAALIAFSRMYLYVHYLSDVIAGILVGIISATLAIVIINKAYEKKKKLN